jgi:predicted methyltransferase
MPSRADTTDTLGITDAKNATALQRRSLLAAAALAALPGCAHVGAADGAALRQAIDGAHRSAANRARDAARHPYETLRFFGLQRQHAVVEIAPGGGWYTEILAPWLHDAGRLYAAHYPRDDPAEGRRKSRAAFEAKLAAEPALYGRVVVGTLPRGDQFVDLAVPGGADAVLTFRNVHNWIEDGHLDDTLRAFARVLKPGGVLGVEEHRAPPGTTLERIVATGYVTEALLVERARAAGFELQARSEVNANPRDTKDHPHGVWSLPPTLRGGDVDRARFLAIGESDRFTHRYVKVRG